MRLAFFLLGLSGLLCAWQPSCEIIGRAGNYRHGVGAGLWVPFAQSDDHVAYGQVDVGAWRRNLVALGVGGGLRRFIGGWQALGVNLFGDITRSSRVTYAQGSLGLEYLTACWRVRANGYWTPNRAALRSEETFQPFASGVELFTTEITKTQREQAYSGFDLELGRGFCFCRGWLWAYAMYSYYTAPQLASIQGSRAGLEVQVDFQRSLELVFVAEYENNSLHGQSISGSLGVRIPFCGRQNGLLCRQMEAPVRRERTIWVDRTTSESRVTRSLDQLLIFVQEGALGPGTFEDPTNLAQATGAAGPGDILYFLDRDGSGDILTGGTVTMQPGQQYYSYGFPAVVTPIPVGGATLFVDPAVFGDSTATLLGNSVNPVIDLADGVLLQGFGIDNLDPGDGLVASGNLSAVMRDLNVDNVNRALILDGVNGLVEIEGGVWTTVGASEAYRVANVAGRTQFAIRGGHTMNSGAFSALGFFDGFASDGAIFDFLAQDSTFVGPGTPSNCFQAAMLFNATDSNTVDMRVSNCDIDAFSMAANIGANSAAMEDFRGVLVFDGNRCGLSSPLIGLPISLFNSAGATGLLPSMINAEVTNNSIVTTIATTVVGVVDFRCDAGASGNTINGLVADNPVLTNIAGRPGVRGEIVSNAMDDAFLNLTVRNNSHTSGVLFGAGGYLYRSTGGTAPVMCIDMTGNNTNEMPGIVLNMPSVPAGALQVTQTGAANLSAVNNGITVSTPGTGTPLFNAGPCPLPVIPPAPIQ